VADIFFSRYPSLVFFCAHRSNIQKHLPTTEIILESALYFCLADVMTVDFNNEVGACVAHMCSESQVFSIGDFDTNYCNLRNVYCNSVHSYMHIGVV
jgi:hypothetical protein